MLGPPIKNRPATVCGTLIRSGTSTQRSVTTQITRVAPKMASTSPGSVAPATTWSHNASMVPPVNTVSVPGSVPPASHMGTTTGSWDGSTPNLSRSEVFHSPLACRPPKEATMAESTAATPDRAKVATAWQGQ